MERVGEGRGDGEDGGFAGADAREVGAVEEMEVEFGDVLEAGNEVTTEAGVPDSAVFEAHFLAEGGGPRPMTMQLWVWARRLEGLRMAPHSKTWVIRRMA
jgi:hypothetical protein